jgi:hypothetical protein
MSVYLGTFGEVELQRQFDGGELRSKIDVGDVDVTKKHFSFDFDHGQLISGDQVEITSTDGSTLDFIEIDSATYADTSIKKFVHVDELDHIRLYDSFENAINGGSTNALTLVAPGDTIPVRVKVENNTFRVLSRVQSYELNTERETVDVTTLSDEFRNRLGTLMSGSGRMACEWEYEPVSGETEKELAHYLLELVLRTKVGSSFKGKFYIKTGGYNPMGHTDGDLDSIWYEVDGVITASAVQFTPNEIVQITADFVTTSDIQIRMATAVPPQILTEDDGSLIVEDKPDDVLAQQS